MEVCLQTTADAIWAEGARSVADSIPRPLKSLINSSILN